ncbi:MAG: hypothetical protein IPI67_12205 [Myxococcales bacterium]|nr:hypothetical protein [Myxococcales bacterium]
MKDDVASESADDDVPPTPKNSVPSEDTERDLAPARQRGSAVEADDISTTLSNSTLLSVKGAAEQSSDEPNHRVDELDRRFDQLEARLKVLELQRSPGPEPENKRWLFWVGLMLALVLGWQLRAYFR